MHIDELKVYGVHFKLDNLIVKIANSKRKGFVVQVQMYVHFRRVPHHFIRR